MSNIIAPGSSADVNVKVTALTTNPNVPVTYKTVILKKNLVNGVNTLTQEMMSVQNTKYVIKYDYILGEDITIPENCVLEFDGGSLANGNIVGNNTKIIWHDSPIFKSNIDIRGTWLVEYISSYMFSDLNFDNSLRELLALNNSNIQTTVVIEKEDYNYPISLVENNESGIEIGSNTHFILNGIIELRSTSLTNYSILSINNAHNVTIEGGGEIIGDRATHIGTEGEWGQGIGVLGSEDVSIKGLTIHGCWGDAIYIGGSTCSGLYISNCELYDNRRQGISVINSERGIIDNCYIHDIDGTSPMACIDIEPNAQNQNVNWIIRNCTLWNPQYSGLSVLGAYNYNIKVDNCSIKGSVLITGTHDMESNINIQNCYISGTLRTDYGTTFAGVIFKGNTLDDCPNTCMDAIFENNKININSNPLKSSVYRGNTINIKPSSTINLVVNNPGDRQAVKLDFTGNIVNFLEPSEGGSYGRILYLRNEFVNEEEVVTTEGSSIIAFTNNVFNFYGVIEFWILIMFGGSNNKAASQCLDALFKAKNNIFLNCQNVWLGNDIRKTSLSVNGALPVCPTESRPEQPNKGMTVFDSTLGKTITYNGTAWVDATGQTV